MKFSNIILICAALLALGIGGLHLFDRLTAGAPVTAKTPEPALPDSRPLDPLSEQPAEPLMDSAAPEQEGVVAAGPAQPQQLVAEIEGALMAADPQQRETAFNSLLPQLLQQDPGSVVGLVARLEPGEPRDALREEVTRQWISRDRDTAVEWIDTLGEAEQKASAVTAMRTLAARSPAEAIAVADKFGVGRDDGSLEHLVQIWATENPEEAMQWLATQPAGPQTDQLRARIEQARGTRP